MPRRALRCVVDLNINAVSAPGVWLPSKEDIYLSVSLFNQYRNTKLTASIFPLILREEFRFEKTYYTAVDPSHVADLLEDELVIFELLQLSEYTDGAVRLATFSTNARDFLYPYPSLAPAYSSTDREILMSRTIAFPGISPKLEFSTRSVINESLSPEIDALEDALEEERLLRRRWKPRRKPSLSRTSDRDDSLLTTSELVSYRNQCRTPSDPIYYKIDHTFQRPTSASVSRSRSPSPCFRNMLDDNELDDDTIDPRPPFVIRKLDSDLIGRSPGGPTSKNAKSKKKSKLLSRSPIRTSLSVYSDLDYPLRHEYKLSKVIREPYEDPLPVYKSRYTTASDDDDAEVAELTSSLRNFDLVKPRARSVSPVLYTPSYRARFGSHPYIPTYTPTYTPTYIPTYTPTYSTRAERILQRRLSLERLDRLGALSPVTSIYRRRLPLYDSLDDLEIDTRLARSRRYLFY